MSTNEPRHNNPDDRCARLGHEQPSQRYHAREARQAIDGVLDPSIDPQFTHLLVKCAIGHLRELTGPEEASP